MKNFTIKEEIVKLAKNNLARRYVCNPLIWDNSGVVRIEYNKEIKNEQKPYLKFVNFKKCTVIIGQRNL